MRRICLSALFLVASTALVHAQDADPRSDDEIFESTRIAVENEDWEQALADFETLARRHPTLVGPRFNIATIRERLGDPRGALEAIESISVDDASPDLVRRVDEAKGRLLRLVGRVQSSSPGVVLRVDADHECDSPCSLPVIPGERRVELLREGEVQDYTLDVVAGETEIVVWIDPERVAETVEVDAAPPVVSEPERRYRPGALTIVGGALAAVGVAGTIGFGLRTRRLKDDFDAAVAADVVVEQRADDLLNQGVRMRRATNASIGVIGLGVAFALLEVILDRN